VENVPNSSRLALGRAPTGPHAGQPVHCAGAPLANAAVAVVAVHGRGGDAQDMLALGAALDATDAAYCAPEAAGHTWYPNRFVAPFHDNEPWLSSALDFLAATVEAIEARGVPRRRIVLLGFSQGGCLALHFGATHATRWGGLAGLSAGLIGPPGTAWDFPPSLDGTPVFLGCSEHDPHIPPERLAESARVLERLGGAVTLRVYPALGHTVNEDELEQVRRVIGSVERPGEA
jgi:predicted esterase